MCVCTCACCVVVCCCVMLCMCLLYKQVLWDTEWKTIIEYWHCVCLSFMCLPLCLSACLSVSLWLCLSFSAFLPACLLLCLSVSQSGLFSLLVVVTVSGGIWFHFVTIVRYLLWDRPKQQGWEVGADVNSVVRQAWTRVWDRSGQKWRGMDVDLNFCHERGVDESGLKWM